ncbi:Chemotaxis protein CheA|nr:Chemotaxis protein CheA [Candidatus Pantoea persica]
MDLLLEELGNLGSLSNVVKGADFVAVLCFVIEEA